MCVRNPPAGSEKCVGFTHVWDTIYRGLKKNVWGALTCHFCQLFKAALKISHFSVFIYHTTCGPGWVGWGRQGHEEGMVSQGARTSLEHGRRTRLPLLWCRIEPWVLQAHGAAGRTDCRPNVVCVAEGKCSREHCCRHCHLLILSVQSIRLYSLTHRNTSTEILQVSCQSQRLGAAAGVAAAGGENCTNITTQGTAHPSGLPEPAAEYRAGPRRARHSPWAPTPGPFCSFCC